MVTLHHQQKVLLAKKAELELSITFGSHCEDYGKIVPRVLSAFTYIQGVYLDLQNTYLVMRVLKLIELSVHYFITHVL